MINSFIPLPQPLELLLLEQKVAAQGVVPAAIKATEFAEAVDVLPVFICVIWHAGVE